MAMNSTLPPQAYTREILATAYNWLQRQPDSIKKLATTPDALVGLFIRAQRYGPANLESEAPVSSQHFVSDLKNLAADMKQFDGHTSSSGSSAAPSSTLSEIRSSSANISGSANLSRSAAGAVTKNGISQGISQFLTAPAAPLAPPLATITSSPSQDTYGAQYQAEQRQQVQAQYLAQQQIHKQNFDNTGATSIPRTYQTHSSAPHLTNSRPAQNFDIPMEHQAGQSGNIQGATGAVNSTLHATGEAGYRSASDAPMVSAQNAQLSLKTRQMLEEIQKTFNLASEAEVINLAVGVAYKNLKALLP
jgi:hypothetical protein